MNNDDILRKLDEARKAMGGNKSTKKELADNLDFDLEKKRSLAARAMEGEAQKEKRKITTEELTKKREEAKQAMETQAQKEAREKLEREERAKELAIKKLNELREEKRKRDLLKEKQKEAGQKVSEDKKINEQEKYLNHLKKTNENISDITSKEDVDIPIYHTLKTDSRHTVKKESMSMTDIALKQQKKDRESSRIESKNKNNKIIIAITIILLLAGAGSIYGAWVFTQNTSSISLEPTRSIISAEADIEINLTNKNKTEIIKTIQETKEGPAVADSISNIYFTTEEEELGKRLATLDEVWLKTELNLPVDLTHFLTERHTFGVHHSSSANPFIILSTSSFVNTLDAMLRFEYQIVNQLLSLFGPFDTSNRDFKDRIIQNLDTRVIENQTGEVEVLYTFLNSNTLLITTNTTTLNKIVNIFRPATE